MEVVTESKPAYRVLQTTLERLLRPAGLVVPGQSAARVHRVHGLHWWVLAFVIIRVITR